MPVIPSTRRTTLGDRAFLVTAARASSALPSYFRSAPSLLQRPEDGTVLVIVHVTVSLAINALLQKTDKVHETITFLLVALPYIHRFKNYFFTHRLSNNPFLIWLLTTPSHLCSYTTLHFVVNGLFC